jgi:hypothetical protein
MWSDPSCRLAKWAAVTTAAHSPHQGFDAASIEA